MPRKTLSRLVDGVAKPSIGQSDWVGHLWALLAECQVRQKKYAAVMTTAEKARAWKADSPTHYMLDEVVGRAWKSQAKFTEATAAFKRVIQSETGSRTETAAKAQLMIAEILFLQKKYPEARDAYLTVHFLYKFPEWQAPALFQAGQCEELIGSNQREPRPALASGTRLYRKNSVRLGLSRNASCRPTKAYSASSS